MRQKSIYFSTLFLIHLSFLSLFGQYTIGSNTPLVITGNTEMSFDCSLINNGIIDNNGTMYVSGNWENNAEYTTSEGRLVLNGTGTQRIDHNHQNFHTLEIDGNDIRVENNLDIEDKLILNNGIVSPAPNAILLVKQNAGIENASGNSYINGALYHEGTGQKLYPIGKDGHYRPVVLQDIMGTNPITGIETFNSNPSPICEPNLNRVTSNMYWQLIQFAGSFEGSVLELHVNYEINDLSGAYVLAQADSLGALFTSIGNENMDNSQLLSEVPLTKHVFSIAENNENPIQIMNIITPNGDGLNDVLYINNLELYLENEVLLLNRAGTEIFSATNYDNTWDTQVDGKYLSYGDYICLVKIKGHSKVYRQMVSILK